MGIGERIGIWQQQRARARVVRLEAAITQARAELEALATDGAWDALDDDPFTAADGRAVLASAAAMRAAIEDLERDLRDARRDAAQRQ